MAEDGNQNSLPIRATVQLPGADWLFGDLVSDGAESFTLKVSEQTAFAIPRSRIETIYFDRHAAPSAGFAGSVRDLEGWTGTAVDGGLSVEGGALVVDEQKWLGRSVSEPPRFEIDFTFPEDAEKGARVWLQPWAMGPNAFTTGTVELSFNPDAISHQIFINGFDEKDRAAPGRGEGWTRSRGLPAVLRSAGKSPRRAAQRRASRRGIQAPRRPR